MTGPRSGPPTLHGHIHVAPKYFSEISPDA
jgi:hypothetical protein